MTHRNSRPASRTAGFTLIELMVVIVILGLLVTIVAPNFTKILGGAKVDTTKAQMSNIEKAIDLYKLRTGKLPDSLGELISSDGNGDLPGSELPKDAWGGEFQYNKIDKKRYDIMSLGADGQEGGEDDEDRDIHREDLHKSAEKKDM